MEPGDVVVYVGALRVLPSMTPACMGTNLTIYDSFVIMVIGDLKLLGAKDMLDVLGMY